MSSNAIEVEPMGNHHSGPCPCCGHATRTAWGNVRVDGWIRAVYFARWAYERPEHGVTLALSIGRWEGDARPGERRCAGLACRMRGSRPEFMVIDAAMTPRADEELLGEKLTRDQALSSGIGPEIFAILDQIIEADPVISTSLVSGC